MKKTRDKLIAARGFTMMELVVVLLILVALIAILVPSLNLAKRNAEITATQALLNSLATGLEEYYNTTEFKGVHPPSGSNSSTYHPPPPPPGVPGLPYPRGSVMLAQGLTGFLPYQLDGAGLDTTSSSNKYFTTPQGVTDPAYGFRMHVGGHGNIYGPYVRTDDPASLRIMPGTTPPGMDQAFIDRWGHEILYYLAVPSILRSGDMNKHDKPRQISSVFAHGSVATPTDPTFTGIFVIEDNLYVKDSSGADKSLPDPSVSTDMSFWRTLGCSAKNTINPGDVVVGADSYLLISAGPDGVYFTKDDIIQVRK